MNALTVCVDFHDYLGITLPRNVRFFGEFCVVTEQCDLLTRTVVDDAFLTVAPSLRPLPHARLSRAFRVPGCSFNKGAGIEDALLQMSPKGWLCILDADIVLPPAFADAIEYLEPGNIYMPKLRRQCSDPLTMTEYADQPTLWDDLPEVPEMRIETHSRDGGAGYCQIFHTSDPVLGERPWYPTNWKDAGGCDTKFLEKWPVERRKRLDFEVLHLGEPETHWCGRTGRFLDGKPVPEGEAHARAMQRMREEMRKHGIRARQT